MSSDDGASKSNDDGVCEVSDMLQNISTADKEDNIVSICANCGKEDENVNNICNKCKQVKYCNAVCKKKHKKKHKKECEEYQRLAADYAVELHDKELFKQPPELDNDCPICFLCMPLRGSGSRYQSCCGKVICCGCLHAPLYDDQGNEVDNNKCPFCRTRFPNFQVEGNKRLKNRIEAGDAQAMFNLGYYYYHGSFGLPHDYDKALKLWQQAAELGSAAAYCSIGCAYRFGHGVEVDKKKAVHYSELAAIAGNVEARYNLGIMEKSNGKMDRALKHFMISIRGGKSDSLKFIKDFYSNGHATKEDYTKALKAYQAYLGEIKSDQRDEAALFSDEYKYY